MDSGTATPKEPLKIAATPHNPPQPKPAVHTLDVGTGTPVKLDALGPMIINSDGVRLHLFSLRCELTFLQTLSRIQNWQDLHPIEQERTVRLLVKKRNLVRLQKLDAEGGSVEGEEKLSIMKEGETASAKEV
jgi:hypothetical protein